MKTPTLSTVTAAATLTTSALAADAGSVSELVAKVSSTDDKVRGPAWQGAASYGAPAVKPLAAVMTNADFEVARAAKRGLWKIVRHAGRPGADAERRAVAQELINLLAAAPAPVSRDLLWMLSEIGDDSAVEPIAAQLANADVCEDARCALERIPGPAAVAALRKALGTAPEKFKYALANSLRVRGEPVDGYPSQKLVPTKQTSVKAG